MRLSTSGIARHDPDEATRCFPLRGSAILVQPQLTAGSRNGGDVALAEEPWLSVGTRRNNGMAQSGIGAHQPPPVALLSFYHTIF